MKNSCSSDSFSLREGSDPQRTPPSRPSSTGLSTFFHLSAISNPHLSLPSPLLADHHPSQESFHPGSSGSPYLPSTLLTSSPKVSRCSIHSIFRLLVSLLSFSGTRCPLLRYRDTVSRFSFLRSSPASSLRVAPLGGNLETVLSSPVASFSISKPHLQILSQTKNRQGGISERLRQATA